MTVLGAIFGGLALALAAAAALPGAAIAGKTWAPLTAGLTLVGAGIALRRRAVRELGRFFTYTVKVVPGQTVVSSGPYRLVRHPSYVGNLLVTAGLGLAADNWVSLACALFVPLAGHVVHIRYEERLLEAELGEPYRDYERRTRRLVPGLW